MSAYKNGTHAAKVISVIETITFIGKGTADDPIRELKQYWNMDGKQLAAVVADDVIPYGYDAAAAARQDPKHEREVAADCND